MRNDRFRFMASSLAAICFGAGVALLPGCGGGEVEEIQLGESPTDAMKDSMEHMRQQYAKKGGSKRGR